MAIIEKQGFRTDLSHSSCESMKVLPHTGLWLTFFCSELERTFEVLCLS